MYMCQITLERTVRHVRKCIYEYVYVYVYTYIYPTLDCLQSRGEVENEISNSTDYV